MLQPLAIQSWCFRHWKPLPEMLERLKQCGVSATELCAFHTEFLDPKVHQSAIETCKKSGAQLVAIGAEKLACNVEQDKPRFDFCKAAGIKHMSVTFTPEAMWDGLRNIEKLAEQYDMKLGIHNHGGYDWLGNPTMLKYIFDNTSPRIGLYMDTAWMIDASQNPVEMAERFADRLHGIHIKDYIYDREGKPKDMVIGTGILDLPKLVTTLKQIKFSGPLVIEYEGDVENPLPALKRCVEAMRKLL